MAELKKLDMAGAFDLHDKDQLTGVFQMTEADYRASPGMNQSLLKHFLKCPAAYKQALEWEALQAKRSHHLELGQLIHLLILEGQEAFEEKVTQLPDLNPRTKLFRETKKELEATGKIIVNSKDLDLIYGIWKSMKADPIASKILNGGKAEIVCFAKHPLGITMKGKIDYVKDDLIIDLKTTTSAEESDFNKSARAYNYDFQAAYYLDLLNLAIGMDRFHKYAILAVEKTPPFLFNYFVIDPKDIELARLQYEGFIRTYIKCKADNDYPGYEPRFKSLNFGGWR